MISACAGRAYPMGAFLLLSSDLRIGATGEMFAPEDAQAAGFLDRLVPPDQLECALAGAVEAVQRVHRPSHPTVKRRLRAALLATMRETLDDEVAAALRQTATRM